MLERIQSLVQSAPKKFYQVFLLGFASLGWQRLFWLSMIFSLPVSWNIGLDLRTFNDFFPAFMSFLSGKKFWLFEDTFEVMFSTEWNLFAAFHLAVSFVAHGFWKSKQSK